MRENTGLWATLMVIWAIFITGSFIVENEADSQALLVFALAFAIFAVIVVLLDL